MRGRRSWSSPGATGAFTWKTTIGPTGNWPDAFPAVSGYARRFYRAHGRYLWFTDCNRWTVERLASVGLAHGGFGVIFSGQVAAGHLVGVHTASGSEMFIRR
jgi:hypothetical protein